jgi:hypothetical protein
MNRVVGRGDDRGQQGWEFHGIPVFLQIGPSFPEYSPFQFSFDRKTDVVGTYSDDVTWYTPFLTFRFPVDYTVPTVRPDPAQTRRGRGVGGGVGRSDSIESINW